MTSTIGFLSPTTDAYKGNEIRVPNKLIIDSFQKKRTYELETITLLKLYGSRVSSTWFFKSIGVSVKTGKRIINRLLKLKWIGYDGTFIFPRSWSRLGFKKSKGLYLCEPQKRIKDFLFTHALKEITRRMARAQEQRSAMPKGLPVRYYVKSLRISERTYYRLIQSAIRRGLIRTKQNFIKVGKKSDYHALKKHLHGVPLFVRGNYTVSPQPNDIKFLI